MGAGRCAPYAPFTTTGDTRSLALRSSISFRGHLATQMPQEVQSLYSITAPLSITLMAPSSQFF